MDAGRTGLSAADLVDDGRVITGRPATIAAVFAAEQQPAMLPLSAQPFDPARAAASPSGSVGIGACGRTTATRFEATLGLALQWP